MMDTLVRRQATPPELQGEMEARGRRMQGEVGGNSVVFYFFLVFFGKLSRVRQHAARSNKSSVLSERYWL